MYKNLKDLNRAYFHGHIKTRNDLTDEQEKSYVKDCFETYEHIGFKETFDSPYDEYKHYNGKKFIILGRVNTEAVDLQYLPMWYIRFENGDEMEAYPEEICEGAKP